MDAFAHDLRFACRSLGRSPWFSTVTIITLALGIGACVAMFSVLYTVALRPLPYPEPDRIVYISEANPRDGWPEFPVSLANLSDWQAGTQAFESLVAWARRNVTLTGGAEPEQVYAMRVSDGALEIMGMRPSRGRRFRAGDHQAGAVPVAIIGDALWERQFGRDPNVVGRILSLNGTAVSVVGVLPVNAVDPFGDQLGLMLPLIPSEAERADRTARQFVVYGRLRPQVALAQARAELVATAARLEQQFPATNDGWTVNIQLLSDRVVGSTQPRLWALLGVVAFVLLIACANVAHLMLLRCADREREISVRAAIGADRRRIIKQLVTESGLLVIAGSGLGLLLSVALVKLVIIPAPFYLPRAGEIGLHPWVLAFAVGLGGVTTLLFGVLPALYASAPNLAVTLRAGASRLAGAGAAGRMRSVFAVSELALAVILLSGAGLLITDLVNQVPTDPGFDIDGKLTARVVLSDAEYGSVDRRVAFYRATRERLAALPSVTSVSAANHVPFDGFSMRSYLERVGGSGGPFAETAIEYRVVSSDFFDAMGIPLVAGRGFTDTDVTGAPGAVVVSESVRDELFGGESALGESVRLTQWQVTSARLGELPVLEGQVVGVVGDVIESRAMGARRTVYVPYLQHPTVPLTFVLNVGGDPASLMRAVREGLWAVDPDQPFADLQTAEALVAQRYAWQSSFTYLMSGFAVVGLVLAAVGVYGVLAYTFALRRKELAVRLAVGASPTSIFGLVVRHGVGLGVAGLAVGLTAASFLARFLSSVLVMVGPRDPGTLVLAAAVLLVVALLATLLPARRASTVDPIDVLRAE